MTRHVIAKEGVPSLIPDLWLEKGSLWMNPDERLYVTMGFDWEHRPIGTALDLQRNEETGEVSVDIQLFQDIDLGDEEYDYSFWAMEFEERKVEATDDIPEHRLILKARVRGIAIVPIAANSRQ